MQRITLVLALLLMTKIVLAQQTIFVNEGFSSMPPSGWTIDAQSGNWSVSNTNNASGTAPEAKFSYSPTFNGVSRLISPTIDLSSASNVVLSFKHFVDHYTTPYSIGVATRANGGAWHTVWTLNPSANVGPADVLITITNGDQTSNAFQFCFFFNGNSYNIDYWYIDNVLLYEPYAVDAALTKVTTSAYIASGNTNVSGVIKNNGLNNITNFTVNYKIGTTGTEHSTNITGINLSSGQSYNFTCTPQWNATPGSHEIILWLSDVNSLGPDPTPNNDTLKKTINVATQTTVRKPVFEEFTSSTCGPCASFNSTVFNPFFNNYGNQFSLVKYQMNWPGSGDPYYTAEGGVRRAYYGVSAVPDLYIDGAPSGMTSTTMLNELNAEKAKPTFFVITTNPTYSGTTVTIPVTITPYLTGTFKLHVVVVEKTTTGNATTNGETSFKHVMMKMITTGAGQDVTFTSGTNYTNTFVQNMSSTHVEEMSDLAVVIMIQENQTKEIFQSSETDIAPAPGEGIDMLNGKIISVYPNPASEHINIKNAENSDLYIFDVFGKLIYSQNQISENHQCNLAGFSKGTYILKLTNGNETLTRKLVIVN